LAAAGRSVSPDRNGGGSPDVSGRGGLGSAQKGQQRRDGDEGGDAEMTEGEGGAGEKEGSQPPTFLDELLAQGDGIEG